MTSSTVACTIKRKGWSRVMCGIPLALGGFDGRVQHKSQGSEKV